MRNLDLKYWFFIAIICFVMVTKPLYAKKSDRYIDTHNMTGKSIAVLPFVNLSGDSKAIADVMNSLYQQLDKHNIVYHSHTDLRPILRKQRIRTLGSIDKDNAVYIKKLIGVDCILLGAVNIYRHKGTPEISVSMRIIDATDLTIISAVTQSATGDDFEKFFGLGKINSNENLTPLVVNKLMTNLLTKSNDNAQQSTSINQPMKIALIPLDNMSETKKAGKICTNILLTTLVQNRYKVIEPGIINKIMQKNKRLFRGEVDLETVRQIKELLDIDILVTGSIDMFKFSRGSKDVELEIGLRTLDASGGKIIIMYNELLKGSESESFFGYGKINAMGNLISKSINNFIHTLEKKSEIYFAKQK